MAQIRDVSAEDLLGREAVTIDKPESRSVLAGQVVMVTGAGGSIGSELCNQIARAEPTTLLLVERAENSLYDIHRNLCDAYPGLDLLPVVADVCDQERMRGLFADYAPSVVFHAAAHKHVPLMESNPCEALKNNVIGTRVVADMASMFGTECFVLISTDKAVNPASIMGATKRLAEDYIQTLGGTSCTRFVAVRFGNVLGSVGSVVPLFQEQINKGGPLTVTHPDMVRYFMTIQEACQLVLEAGAIGRGGEILALDMGEPMKILDLARRMIALSDPGQPEDIRIEITGLRPGEKLVEELWFNHEELQTTRCAKIFVHKAGQARERTPQELILGIDAAIKDSGNVRAHIQELVPCYQPNPEVSVAHTR